MSGEYTIQISPDGQQTTIDAEGFHGTACEDSIRVLLDALGDGELQEVKKKPEYYENTEEYVKVGT